MINKLVLRALIIGIALVAVAYIVAKNSPKPVASLSPTPTPISSPQSNQPKNSYPTNVARQHTEFTCFDPTVGQGAPCVQDTHNPAICVDIANGHAFRCIDTFVIK